MIYILSPRSYRAAAGVSKCKIYTDASVALLAYKAGKFTLYAINDPIEVKPKRLLKKELELLALANGVVL